MEKANQFSLGPTAHAAKRAADMVYILHVQPHSTERDVEQILKVYGETNPKITKTDLIELKAASKRLYAIFITQKTDFAVNLINELLRDYAHQPRLSAHSATPWHLHIDSNDHAPWAEWFAASSAFALAILLAEKQRNVCGICICGKPFIDLGKGGGRKYCSSRCSTRERVANHRRKRLPEMAKDL
ncbi:MAG TPA: CGNR zinc finger domain-containing protein [Candidatus Saccharimonadales bacterium]|nr:CGNR zinc finger domain-containing protein [Candidatus Saccharimonadales bacterium]